MRNSSQTSTQSKEHREVLKKLKEVRVKIGVFDEDAEKTITVKLKDEVGTEVQITVADALYLTEHGSIYTPPRPVLSQIKRWVKDRIKLLSHEITFDKSYTTDKLISRLRIFKQEVNAIIQVYISLYEREVTFVAGLAGDGSENVGSFAPLETLRKYIKCKILVGDFSI